MSLIFLSLPEKVLTDDISDVLTTISETGEDNSRLDEVRQQKQRLMFKNTLIENHVMIMEGFQTFLQIFLSNKARQIFLITHADKLTAEKSSF